MIGAIPNPKKSITIDFPIDKVKIGVERVDKLSSKYKFTKSNQIFNQTTFEATEFLSIGVYIDIILSVVNENKTEITIEIRRKVGAFDQSHEVTKANEHIENIVNLISLSIGKTDEEVNTMILNSNREAEIKQANNKKIAIWCYSIFAILGVAFYFYVKYKKQ